MKIKWLIFLIIIWFSANIVSGKNDLKTEQEYEEEFREIESQIMESYYEAKDIDIAEDIKQQKVKLKKLINGFVNVFKDYKDNEDTKEAMEDINEEIETLNNNLDYVANDIAGWIKRLKNLNNNMQNLGEYVVNEWNKLYKERERIKKTKNVLSLSQKEAFKYWYKNFSNIYSQIDYEKLEWIINYKINETIENYKDKLEEYKDHKELYYEARVKFRDYFAQQKNKLEDFNKQNINFASVLEEVEEENGYEERYHSAAERQEDLKNHLSLIEEKDFDDENSIKETLQTDKDYEDDFFSWPVLPKEWFTNFFDDPRYEERYDEEYKWLDIRSSQGDEIFAPANWKVYKVEEHDDYWLNWIIIAHPNDYFTVYTRVSKVLVRENSKVEKWDIIALSWWKPWTRWAWVDSSWPHLQFKILKDWEYKDPLKKMDLSVVWSRHMLPTKYHEKYMEDIKDREFDIEDVPYYKWDTVEQRRKSYLSKNAVSPFDDISIWRSAKWNTDVDIDLGICIGAAESWLWANMTTEWNVWNVGNNDRWDRVWYDSPEEWARMIFTTLVNQYLWDHNKLTDLSRYWNKNWSIYASSDENWQRNVTRCLSGIKGVPVPENYFFREYTGNKDIVYEQFDQD